MDIIEGRMIATRTPEKQEANRTILLTTMLVIMLLVIFDLTYSVGQWLGVFLFA